MKIYCFYNYEYHIFLNKVVELVLNQYGSDLNISTLREIELRNINEFEIITDGRTVGNGKIIVTSRLYDYLPTLDLEKLQENEDYKRIRQTIHHEMGHINDMAAMPNLYKYASDSGNNKEQEASQFWLEYLADKRSVGFEGLDDDAYCKDFVNNNWECTMSSTTDNFDDRNYAYLTKHLPYFIARTEDDNIRNKYMYFVRNSLLKEYINEADIELKKLEKIYPFDDMLELNDLFHIINKYYHKFMSAFRR